MAPPRFRALGRLGRSHGLAGEVSFVAEDSVPLESLIGTPAWIVPPLAFFRSTRLIGARPGPKSWLVALEGVDDIETARQLTGRELLVRESDAPEAWAEEPAVADETGYAVTDEVRGLLGTIEEIIITGANDVWLITGPFGEVLVPVIDDVVLEVDAEKRTVLVRLLPGLLKEDDDA